MPQIRLTGFLVSLAVSEMFLAAPIPLLFLINFNLTVSHQGFPILCKEDGIFPGKKRASFIQLRATEMEPVVEDP